MARSLPPLSCPWSLNYIDDTIEELIILSFGQLHVVEWKGHPSLIIVTHESLNVLSGSLLRVCLDSQLALRQDI